MPVAFAAGFFVFETKNYYVLTKFGIKAREVIKAMLNLTSDNLYTLLGCSISIIILMSFGVLSKRYITYKRIKFEIMHDLSFTQKFWSEAYCGEEKDCQNAKNILSQDSQMLLNFIENLPKGRLMCLGVPQMEVLSSIADSLMAISQSISPNGITEKQCNENKIAAEEIKIKFGIKK